MINKRKNADRSDLQDLTDALSQRGYLQPRISSKSIHLPRPHSNVVYLSEGTHVFEPQDRRDEAPCPVIYFDPKRQLLCYPIPWDIGNSTGISSNHVIMDCVKTTVHQFLKNDIKTQCGSISNEGAVDSEVSAERGRILPRFGRLMRAVFG